MFMNEFDFLKLLVAGFVFLVILLIVYARTREGIEQI
jgi:hypothetical protein